MKERGGSLACFANKRPLKSIQKNIVNHSNFLLRFFLMKFAWLFLATLLFSNEIKIELDDHTIDILEEEIPVLAIKALKQAYLDALASGSTVLIVRDDFLIEVHPNGTETIIQKLPPSTEVTVGKIIIK